MEKLYYITSRSNTNFYSSICMLYTSPLPLPPVSTVTMAGFDSLGPWGNAVFNIVIAFIMVSTGTINTLAAK